MRAETALAATVPETRQAITSTSAPTSSWPGLVRVKAATAPRRRRARTTTAASRTGVRAGAGGPWTGAGAAGTGAGRGGALRVTTDHPHPCADRRPG
ncbi:hypothetical protein GCM10027047_08330 [Rhodococcus aerolatus]